MNGDLHQTELLLRPTQSQESEEALRFALGGNVDQQKEQLKDEARNLMILQRSPALITMFSFEGSILHQNRESRVYYGDRVGSATDCLALIFSLDENKLVPMYETLTRPGGGLWKAVVRVPHSLATTQEVGAAAMGTHGTVRMRIEDTRAQDLPFGPSSRGPSVPGRNTLGPEHDPPYSDRRTPVSISGCVLSWDSNNAQGRSALASPTGQEGSGSGRRVLGALGVKMEPTPPRFWGAKGVPEPNTFADAPAATTAPTAAQVPQSGGKLQRKPHKRNSWVGEDGPEPRAGVEVLRPESAGPAFVTPGKSSTVLESGTIPPPANERARTVGDLAGSSTRSLRRSNLPRFPRSTLSLVLPTEGEPGLVASGSAPQTHVTPLRAGSTGVGISFLRAESLESGAGGSGPNDALATSTFATLITAAHSRSASVAPSRAAPASVAPSCGQHDRRSTDDPREGFAPVSHQRKPSCHDPLGPATIASTASDASIGPEGTNSNSGSFRRQRRPISRALSFALSLGTSPVAAAGASSPTQSRNGSPAPSTALGGAGSPRILAASAVGPALVTSSSARASGATGSAQVGRPRSRRGRQGSVSYDPQSGIPQPRPGSSRLASMLGTRTPSGHHSVTSQGMTASAACSTLADSDSRRRTVGGSCVSRPWSGVTMVAAAGAEGARQGVASGGGSDAGPDSRTSAATTATTNATAANTLANLSAATASWADTAATASTNLQLTGRISTANNAAAAGAAPRHGPSHVASAVDAVAADPLKKPYSGTELLFVANVSEAPPSVSGNAQSVGAKAGVTDHTDGGHAHEQRVTPQLGASPFVKPDCAATAAGALSAAAFQEPRGQPRQHLHPRPLPQSASLRSCTWTQPQSVLAGVGGEGRDEDSSEELLARKASGLGEGPDEQRERWHEVWATAAQDPVTGQDVIVLTQLDVTAKVIAERHLALVMEAEHRLVEQLFPRHILQRVTEDWLAGEAATGAVAAVGGGGVGAASVAGPGQGWRPVLHDCNELATWHPEVTLLFADIKGFTPMCKELEPRQVMTLLNALYSRYDAMLDRYGVYKVETIGDCYFVAGGLIREDEDGMAAVREGSSKEDPIHAERVFMFAKAMLAAASEVSMPTTGRPVEIRIGIHTGPVVSGVVGTRMPRFCLFGDTVNTASRMESTGVPGAIHVSEATYARLPRGEQWKPTGGIEVKGKGLMQTYLWLPDAAMSEIHRMPAECEASGGSTDEATQHPPSIQLLSLAFDVVPEPVPQPSGQGATAPYALQLPDPVSALEENTGLESVNELTFK